MGNCFWPFRSMTASTATAGTRPETIATKTSRVVVASVSFRSSSVGTPSAIVNRNGLRTTIIPRTWYTFVIVGIDRASSVPPRAGAGAQLGGDLEISERHQGQRVGFKSRGVGRRIAKGKGQRAQGKGQRAEGRESKRMRGIGQRTGSRNVSSAFCPLSFALIF